MNFVPATASSGFVVRVVMVAAAFAGGASGPGSAATPESAGIASGVGAAVASAGRRRAPASAATAATSFVWVVMVATPSHFNYDGMTLIV